MLIHSNAIKLLIFLFLITTKTCLLEKRDIIDNGTLICNRLTLKLLVLDTLVASKHISKSISWVLSVSFSFVFGFFDETPMDVT